MATAPPTAKSELERIIKVWGKNSPVSVQARRVLEMLAANPELEEMPEIRKVVDYFNEVGGPKSGQNAMRGINPGKIAGGVAGLVDKVAAKQKDIVTEEQKDVLTDKAIEAGAGADQGERDFYETHVAPALTRYEGASAGADAKDAGFDEEDKKTLADYLASTGQYSGQITPYATSDADVAAQQKALEDIQADLSGGDKDQREIFELMKSRMGVEQTAQERLLYELNRRQRESQDASSRAAVMDRQAARGLRSGGAELASMQQAGQQTGEERLLADMQANAGAVQRAQSYTTLGGNMANYMRSNQQKALELQGTQSNAIRSADDTVGMFKSKFEQGEAQRLTDLANQTATQSTASTTARRASANNPVNRAAAGITMAGTVGGYHAGAYDPTRTIAGHTFKIEDLVNDQDIRAQGGVGGR